VASVACVGLDNFSLLIVSQWGSYEELHLIQYGVPSHLCFMFVNGLTTILLVVGLVVAD
jgi:hypothetical protein